MSGIKVGVLVAREATGSAWEPYTWRPVAAIVPPPDMAAWTRVRETPEQTLFMAGVAEIELHRNEVPNYLDNLAGSSPSLYVVLRQVEIGEPPLVLHLVTPSPTEVQAYGEGGEEIIGPVPMPESLIDAVGAFAAEHHVEETFVKRRRQDFRQAERRQFGQESLAELRARGIADRADGGKS